MSRINDEQEGAISAFAAPPQKNCQEKSAKKRAFLRCEQLPRTEMLVNAALNFYLTAVAEKTTWKYPERSP